MGRSLNGSHRLRCARHSSSPAQLTRKSPVETSTCHRTRPAPHEGSAYFGGAGVWSPTQQEVVAVSDRRYDARLGQPTTRLAELREQAKALEEEVVVAPAPAAGRAQAGAHARGAAARDQGPARPGGLPEREAHLHPARGARAHRRAPRRGRQAHPAAVGLRHAPRRQRRRHRRRVLRRPQDAGRAAPRARPARTWRAAPRSCSTSRSTSCSPARASSPARSSRSRRCSTTARALIVGRADEERVVELADAAAGPAPARGRHVLMDPRSGLLLERLPRPEVEELVLEEVPDISYDDVGGLDEPDRADHRRGRAAVPAPGAVRRAQAAGAQGHPAVRPARAAARRSSPRRSPTRWPRRWPRSPATTRPAATSSTSRAPSCSTSTSARPSARSASCSSGRGRSPRRAGPSSSSSTRWTRCSAPAAPASAPTWSRRSCRSCWPRSTASRR